jgi:NAD(P)-dependent dehydrogenase (short-subunit alcohol dehydrogenase family)
MKDQIIFITGASGGIGRALALRCAGQGATVVLHGKNTQKLETLYDEIVDAGGGEPFLMPLDFTQAPLTAFDDISNAIQKECGRLDALVHCAATLGAVSPIEQQSAEQLRSTWLVNVMGTMMLTRALARPLRAAPSPRVVFTTDSHVAAPGPYWGGYGVSKAAVDHFARMLALEWEHARVHTLVPGAVDSPLRQKTHPGEAKASRVSMEDVVRRYLGLLAA